MTAVWFLDGACPPELVLPGQLSLKNWSKGALPHPALDSLFEMLGGQGRALIGSLEPNHSFDPWHTLVVAQQAQRSQFDVLLEWYTKRAYAPGPIACLAVEGRDFHGQHGRAWQTLAGNLHLSLALFPRLNARRVGVAWTVLPALAALDAVRELCPLSSEIGIKWVNDILIEGRKVAGVITASHVLGELTEVVVLGIGINLAKTPRLDLTPHVQAATSLAEHTQDPRADLANCLPLVLEAIMRWYGVLLQAGPAALIESYRSKSLIIGNKVSLWGGGQGAPAGSPEHQPELLASGVVLAINDDLSLQIEGHSKPIERGRLVLHASG